MTVYVVIGFLWGLCLVIVGYAIAKAKSDERAEDDGIGSFLNRESGAAGSQATWTKWSEETQLGQSAMTGMEQGQDAHFLNN